MIYSKRRWNYWSGESIRFNCNIVDMHTGEIVFKQGDVIKWEDFVQMKNVTHDNNLMDDIDLLSHKEEEWLR